jgi:hypothetical protein
MISTAVDLLEASLRTMHSPETMIMFKVIVDNKDNLDKEQFMKALFDYSSHLIAKNSSEILDVLLTPEELSDLNATIQELDEMEKIFNGN